MPQLQPIRSSVLNSAPACHYTAQQRGSACYCDPNKNCWDDAFAAKTKQQQHTQRSPSPNPQMHFQLYNAPNTAACEGSYARQQRSGSAQVRGCSSSRSAGVTTSGSSPSVPRATSDSLQQGVSSLRPSPIPVTATGNTPSYRAAAHIRTDMWPTGRMAPQQQPAAARGPLVARAHDARTPHITFSDGCGAIVTQYTLDSAGKKVPLRQYRCGRLLGQGAFARVFVFTDLVTCEDVAAKVIEKSKLREGRKLQKLRAEIDIHRSMAHPHIVKYYDHFEDMEYHYIILELCLNKTLIDVSKSHSHFSVPEVQYIMLQLLSATQYMHDHNVLHRDMKLGNIMIDRDLQMKVGDFGLAARQTFQGEKKRTLCGTPNYIAPEIIADNGRDPVAGYDSAADIWSLGVIMYTLFVGKPPFEAKELKTTYARIRAGQYSFPPEAVVPPEAKDLIMKILQCQPELRPSLVEIRSHGFFRDPTPPTSPPPALAWCVLGSGTLPPHSSSPVGTARIPAGEMASPRTSAPQMPSSSAAPPHRAEPEIAMMPQTIPSTSPKRTATRPAKVRGITWSELWASKTIQTWRSSVPLREQPRVWVERFVDYSQKYGVAYYLNTGHLGVFYNDRSKIVWDPITGCVDYFARVKTGTKAYDERTSFSIAAYPADLSKKVTLLSYFQSLFTRPTAAENDAENNVLRADGNYLEPVSCCPLHTTPPALPLSLQSPGKCDGSALGHEQLAQGSVLYVKDFFFSSEKGTNERDVAPSSYYCTMRYSDGTAHIAFGLKNNALSACASQLNVLEQQGHREFWAAQPVDVFFDESHEIITVVERRSGRRVSSRFSDSGSVALKTARWSDDSELVDASNAMDCLRREYMLLAIDILQSLRPMQSLYLKLLSLVGKAQGHTEHGDGEA